MISISNRKRKYICKEEKVRIFPASGKKTAYLLTEPSHQPFPV